MAKTVFDLVEQKSIDSDEQMKTRFKEGSASSTVFDMLDSSESDIKLDEEPSFSEKLGRTLSRATGFAIKPSPSEQEALSFGARGASRGLGTLGSLLELAGLQTTRQLPGEEIRQRQEAEMMSQRPSFSEMLGETDILPERAVIPTGEQTQRLAELLGAPTGEPETMTGRFSERIGEALGSAASFGGAGALPLAAGAVTGQTVEELTGSPTAGTIVELATTFAPTAAKGFAKKLVPGKKTKDLINVGRKLGLAEEQIAPLTKDPKTLKRIAKFARKGDKTEKLVFGLKSSLGDAYGTVKESAKNLKKISPEVQRAITSDFEKVLGDMSKTLKPPPEKQQAINFITDAINDLKSKPTDPETLINTFQDLNDFVNWNSIKNGKKQLAALKKPLLAAIKTSSPEVAKDFEVLNQMYSRFKNIQRSLKPGEIDKWLGIGEAGSVVLSLATGFPGAISAVLKEGVIRRGGQALLREFLINPRFQNVQKKLLKAVKDDNIKSVAKIGSQAIKMLRKEFPNQVKDKFDENFFSNLSKQDKE